MLNSLKNHKYVYSYKFAPCNLWLCANDAELLEVSFTPQFRTKNCIQQETDLIKAAKAQLDEYFAGQRKMFDIPFNLNGTLFQQKVWNALLKIPYGAALSYKDIAVIIGNANASRAVGNANNKNPLPIIIPCHRVIGKYGNLTGYAGGLDVKNFLLELEKKINS